MFFMKKINLFILSVAVLAGGLLSSCTKDSSTSFSDPVIKVNLNALTVLSSSSATTADLTKPEGTALSFEIKFDMGDQSDKLTKILITSVISGKTFTVVDSALNSGIFNTGASTLTYSYSTSVGTNNEAITFAVWDKKERKTEVVLNLKPEAATPNTSTIVTRDVIILGSYKNSSLGSSYSVGLNKVLNMSSAKSSSGDVDIMYYYGTGNFASLGAPANADVKTVFNSSATGIQLWATKNDTKFKKITVANWDNVVAADITAATLGTDNQIIKLSVGDILVFQTAGSIKGYIKVTDITTGDNGQIKLSFKLPK